MNPGKLANGFRMISAGIPDPLASGHEDIIGALRVVRVRGVGDTILP